MGGAGGGEAMIRLLRFRLHALRAAISLYRALNWRERSAIYVCWFSLETADERERFRTALPHAVFNAWSAASDMCSTRLGRRPGRMRT
jgi:hypothetical protein